MGNDKIPVKDLEKMSIESAELRNLYIFGLWLGWGCFVCAGIGLFILAATYIIVSDPRHHLETMQQIFAPSNAQPLLLCFFLLMLHEPSNFVVSLAYNPRDFFEKKKNYKMGTLTVIWSFLTETKSVYGWKKWIIFWSVLTCLSIGLLYSLQDKYKEVVLFCDELILNLYVGIFPLLLIILCIVIVEYYKRWIESQDALSLENS